MCDRVFFPPRNNYVLRCFDTVIISWPCPESLIVCPESLDCLHGVMAPPETHPVLGIVYEMWVSMGIYEKHRVRFGRVYPNLNLGNTQ